MASMELFAEDGAEPEAISTGVYLDRLEINNFKSYKGLQTIGPFSRFTSIIGPNGAGKSNLMDAISFVLGVSARQLRGNAIKDMIYGARSKKEAGRASVSAFFKYHDDEDKELVLKRSISGSASKYAIDGKNVSWDEYDSQLREFGLLVKARNFLVFQGDVESVAARDAKQLTQMFEQISGSDELAEEYHAAQRERERANADHQLIGQKKRGLNKEKKQYKAQKEEADRFNALEEEKKHVEEDQLVWQLYHCERDLEQARASVESKQLDCDKLIQRRATVEDLAKNNKKAVAKAKQARALAAKKAKKQEDKTNELKPEFLKAKEEVKHAERRLQAAEKTLASTKQKLQQYDEEIQELEAELHTIERNAKQFEDSIRGESQQDEIQLEENQMAEYQRLKEEVAKRGGLQKSNVDRCRREIEMCQAKCQRIRAERDELEARKQQLQQDSEKLELRTRKVAEALERQRAQANEKRHALTKLQEEQAQLDTERNEASARLAEVQNILQEARSATSESNRARQFDNAIADLKRHHEGRVFGKLVELCEPRHRRYNVAITVIMGKNMDAVVVDNEETAIECIQFLRERRAGVGTFIPLQSIRTKPINERLRTLGNGTSLVVDVLKYAPEIEKAVLFACGNSVVCQNEEEAKRLCYETDFVTKAITLSGTLIRSSGPIEGGQSAVAGKAKRWDEQKLVAVREEFDQLRRKVHDLSRRKNRQHEVTELDSSIRGLEAMCMQLESDRSTSQVSLQQKQAELVMAEERVAAVGPRLAAAEAEAARAQEQLNRAEQQYEAIVDELFAAFCASIGVANIREYEADRLQRVEARAQRRADFTKHIASLRAQLELQRQADPAKDVKRQEEQLEQLTERLQKAQALERELSDQLTEESAGLDRLRAIERQRQQELADAEVALNEYKAQMSEVVGNLNAAQRELRAALSGVERCSYNRHALLKRAKVEDVELPLRQGSLSDVSEEVVTGGPSVSINTSNMSAMDVGSMDTDNAQRIFEREATIQLDYRGLDDDLRETETEEDREQMLQHFQRRLHDIQSEMETIAPNGKALERLEAAKEKLKESSDQFATSQKRTEQANAEFERLKRLRRERFMEAYEQISKRIDGIYKELTRGPKAPVGGTAYLTLEDTEEPYNAGIKYSAMPPSKRFRDMEQLSGGEKTVAALALLFAIHSFKPAPFFVLDEVDAALDNANVNKIARYMRKRSGTGFQCIVISLKDTFFSQSESLVGIYREPEEECSRTLAVDLSRYPEAVN